MFCFVLFNKVGIFFSFNKEREVIRIYLNNIVCTAILIYLMPGRMICALDCRSMVSIVHVSNHLKPSCERFGLWCNELHTCILQRLSNNSRNSRAMSTYYVLIFCKKRISSSIVSPKFQVRIHFANSFLNKICNLDLDILDFFKKIRNFLYK